MQRLWTQVQPEENGWFDCEGISGAVAWPYCYAVKPAITSVTDRAGNVVDQASKGLKLVKTAVIILLFLGLGSATFIGINAFRKRKSRKNPKKKQGIGNRIARIFGGLVLAGLGAIGYAGPQAAEPISTLIGGGMGLGGLYLVGSGVVGPDQANKIRKEIRG